MARLRKTVEVGAEEDEDDLLADLRDDLRDTGEIDSRLRLAVVFIDIARSTELYDRLGDEIAKELVSRTLELIREQSQKYSGQILRVIGDEALCVFPALDRAVVTATSLSVRVQGDPRLSPHRVGLRIGMSYGPVILDEVRELYGDVANVAARMRSLAREGQILMPADLRPHMGAAAALFTRNLGPAPVKGKQEPIEILEVLWNRNERDRTAVAEVSNTFSGPPVARIELIHPKGRHTFELEDLPVTIGRGFDSKVVVAHHQVSRRHATILREGKHFVLKDQSTNGSVLKIGETAAIRVHRSQAYLHDEGSIVVGRTADPEGTNTILFRCS